MEIQLQLNKCTNNIFFGHQSVSITKFNLRKHLEQGLSVSEIADIYNTKVSFIEKLISSYNLTSQELIRLKQLEEDVLLLRNEKATVREIINKTGASKKTITKLLHNLFPEGYVKAKKSVSFNEVINTNNSEDVYKIFRVPNMISQNETIQTSKRINRKIEMCIDVLELKSQGLNVVEIAKRLNKSVVNIRGYLQFCQQKNLDLDSLKKLI